MEHKKELFTKEVVKNNTIYLVFYDEEGDELYRMVQETVEERIQREDAYYQDKYNDEMEGYR